MAGTQDWRVEFLARTIAPGITSFVTADIPSLEREFPEAGGWMEAHFETAHVASFEDGLRQLVQGLARREYHAFTSYHQARRDTQGYLRGNDPLDPKVREYYDAIGAWESFALQCAMALDLINTIGESGRVFEKRDGSPEQRLHTMANQIKHIESCIRSGQCKPNETVPLWLENEGLVSWDVRLGYEDASAVLRQIAAYAQDIQYWWHASVGGIKRYVSVRAARSAYPANEADGA